MHIFVFPGCMIERENYGDGFWYAYPINGQITVAMTLAPTTMSAPLAMISGVRTKFVRLVLILSTKRRRIKARLQQHLGIM